MKYLVILCLALTACGNKTKEDVGQQVKNTGNANGNAAASNSSYATACASSTIPDVGAIKFPGVKTQYDLSTLDFTRKRVYYTDGDCKTAAFVVEEKGKVDILGKSNAVTGALDENFNFTQTTVTIQSETLVKGFNFFEVCGGKDWTAGVPKDVSAQASQKTCPGKPSPRIAQEVVLVEGDKLYLGHDSDSPSRPAQVDRSVVYVKQP